VLNERDFGAFAIQNIGSKRLLDLIGFLTEDAVCAVSDVRGYYVIYIYIYIYIYT
jgi:hypothetical protein